MASSSLVGTRVERRVYFSDPRVREELMKLYHVRFALPVPSEPVACLTVWSLRRLSRAK